MKKIIIGSLIMLLAFSCGKKNQYIITVNAVGGPDSLMVHNNWYTSSDTLKIRDGKCTFTGVIDTFPKLVSIGFPLPSQLNTRMILEPGKITVNYTKEGGYKIGGTQDNITLQKLFDELKPWQDEVMKAWRAWGKVNSQVPRDKNACEAAWVAQEEVKKRNLEKTRELIKTNPNYAGLVISLPIAGTEPAENLKNYVDAFKAFKDDERYQGIVKDYEIADRTVSGKPVPGFTFPDTTGHKVSLSDFKGKWVLLDFWYVDCPWCRKLTPIMIEIYKDWKQNRNFEIVSISVDKPKDFKRWREAIVDDKSPWTQVIDSTKTYPDVYGITGYPTLILVDPNGNGVKKIVGYQEEGGLRRLLGEYVK